MPADKQKVAGSPAGIQSNPSAAVAAAIQMEREQTHQHRQQQQQNLLARNLMIRRASMPGMGGAGMGMGMAAGLSGSSAHLGMAPAGQNVLGRAIALRTEQHQSAMQMHRALIAANTGVGPQDGVEMAIHRASIGLGVGAGPGASPGPGPGPGGSSVPSAGEEAQNQHRMEQLRAARAEVRAAQAKLATLERQAVQGADDATQNDKGANSPIGKNDNREREAAEAFLSLKASSPGGNGISGAAAKGVSPATQPRRVSMDVDVMTARSPINALGAGAGAGLLPPQHNDMSVALLTERLVAERRLSNAAAAMTAEAVAMHRRTTFPIVSGYGIESALAMSGMGGYGRKRKSLELDAGGIYDIVGAARAGGGGATAAAVMAGFPIGAAVPTISQTTGTTKPSRCRPHDAPQRPLSAYNFFFIDERERVLKATKKSESDKANTVKEEKEEVGEDKKGDNKNDDSRALPTADEEKDGTSGGDKAPEDANSKPTNEQKVDAEDNSKQVNIPELEVDENYEPSSYEELMTLRLNSKEKPRPHRKTHGKIGFQSLAKLIASRWKALSDEKRHHYKALAGTDMERYKEKMAEYQKKKLASVGFEVQE